MFGIERFPEIPSSALRSDDILSKSTDTNEFSSAESSMKTQEDYLVDVAPPSEILAACDIGRNERQFETQFVIVRTNERTAFGGLFYNSVDDTRDFFSLG